MSKLVKTHDGDCPCPECVVFRKKHSPLPWHVFHGVERVTVDTADNTEIARVFQVVGVGNRAANAAFIVRACNNYDALVNACKMAEAALASCYDVQDFPANGESDCDIALRACRDALKALEV